MKIKAQISMVMNLDKCLGCHTCSITCKNAWTNRTGTEYMYFNNVETRPGRGYPRDWEDQDRWLGGWELVDGKLRLRSGGKLARFLKLFYNPEQPGVHDYFEPYTYDYDELVESPRRKHSPVARPRSLVTGNRMDITWGPNWDDDLAGTEHARQDANLQKASEVGTQIKLDLEDLFMKYLPRTCNHCLNPACVAACPSGALYKRDEDGVVLISQDQCRGWRACVPSCPYKKIFYNYETNKSEKCTFCYPRLESGLPTICSDTCVGRLRYNGVLLYDEDKVKAAASTEDPAQIWCAIKDVLADPFDPAVIASAKEGGVSDSWILAAQDSPVHKLICEWNLALPLHAEYRTLPMVWYIPPLSPILSRVAATTDLADADEMRIPVAYLAELFSAGDPQPVRSIINKMTAMRQHMRAKGLGLPLPETAFDAEELEEMYQLLAIADRADRFNVPEAATPVRAERLAAQRECGFSNASKQGRFDV
ncbi:nitrate reductase subunit beta [Curtanaerobium respiraculi]|uniref:nitrate reductase subunit beta n=1 Tax=Curtanaerobium respiraculi TaxID=2949669 RepID=UPI0024B3B991|nr:nitrate reductase subunit beta [Curtanaerobium respiraculi]